MGIPSIRRGLWLVPPDSSVRTPPQQQRSLPGCDPSDRSGFEHLPCILSFTHMLQFEEYKMLPHVLCTDLGTEVLIIASTLMWMRQGDSDSHAGDKTWM